MEKYKISYVEGGDPTEKTCVYEYTDGHTNMGAAVVREFVEDHDMANIISFRMERVK